MSKPGSDLISLSVKRKFKASAERVFDAFTDPAKAGKFMFATSSGTMVRSEIDARVGGRYLFTDRRGGEDVEHTGEYLVVDRPRRLQFTLRVEKYSQDTDRITVDIEPLAEGGCELTLTHEVPPSMKDLIRRAQETWADLLELAAQVLGEPDAKPPLPTALVSRRFKQRPERVFDAWLSEKMIGTFMFGPQIRDEKIVGLSIDARVGGRFSFKVERDGELYDHVGTYRVIDRPRRLHFTWQVGEDAEPSLVKIDFVPQPDGCELILEHEMPIEWKDFVGRAEGSWRKMCDKLAEVLS